MRIRKLFGPLLLALLLTWSSFGLAQSGTLELAVPQAPVGLDPHLVTAFSSIAILGQIYDGLLEINADLQLEPALAESWSVSGDGLTYTFDLRDGVVFHNGRAMTSADVVYSFDRIMAEETGSPVASRFSQVASVSAPDADTVVFTLTDAFAPFLANLPSLTVVAQEVVEANGDLQQVAVGTGPFTLGEIIPDTSVTLNANPDYYRAGEPGVAAIRYNVVPEGSTQAAGLRNGSYHMLPVVEPATAETLRGAGGIALLEAQNLAYSLVGMNTTRQPLSDPRVRQAINLALNRAEIVDAVYFGNAVPGGPLSPGLSDWALDTGEFPCYQHDAGAARALLEEAGALGATVEILAFGTLQVVSDLAQVVQAQLIDAGFDAEVNIAEFGTFVQRWRNSDFDLFVSLNGGNIDPDGYLYRTFTTGGSTNVFLYSNVQIDAMLDAGRVNTDFNTRQGIYQQVQRLLACDGPIAHVAYGTLFTAVADGVDGFQQMPTQGLRYLRNVTLR